MKNLLFILLSIPLLFSSCQTCKECEPDEVEQVITGYEQVWIGNTPGGFYTDANGQIQQYPSTPIYEQVAIYGDGIKMSLEICKDNFQSKGDYNAYISNLEDQGYTCRSDFWN
tara:strand:- start:927 stop:1265 length:339 start_codon:yes stop_codon:yes gene_type:complete